MNVLVLTLATIVAVGVAAQAGGQIVREERALNLIALLAHFVGRRRRDDRDHVGPAHPRLFPDTGFRAHAGSMQAFCAVRTRQD